MTNREQRSIRKKWRETKAEYRRQEKIMNKSTPPQSVADNGENRRASACLRQRARRKIAQLTADADAQRRSKERYKRRWLRLKLTSGAYLRTQQSCVSSLNEQDASVMNESLTVSISAETVSTGSLINRHHGNALDEPTKQLLLDFFERDDNTRITTVKTDMHER